MNRLVVCIAAICTLVVAGLGCDKPKPGAETPKPPAPQAGVPADFVLAAAPAGAKDIVAAKATLKEGDEVILHGVVGGTEKPIAETQATVQLIDPTVLTCDKMGMGGECKTPWDACCHQKEAKEMGMMVLVVDAAGAPLKGSLAGVGGLKPGKDP